VIVNESKQKTYESLCWITKLEDSMENAQFADEDGSGKSKKPKKGRRWRPGNSIKEFRVFLGKEFIWKSIKREDGTMDFVKNFTNRKGRTFPFDNISDANAFEEKYLKRLNTPAAGAIAYENVFNCHIWKG
jgi:hypothetical protein